MTRIPLAFAALCFACASAQAAEPIRIGITTILSGPTADRGQSEQYGAQLALDRINEAGGVLGTPGGGVLRRQCLQAGGRRAGDAAADRAGACAGGDRRAVHAGDARDHAADGAGQGAAGDRDLGGAGFRRCQRRRRQRLCVQDDPVRDRHRGRADPLAAGAEGAFDRHRHRPGRLPESQRRRVRRRRRSRPASPSPTPRCWRRGRIWAT